MNRSQVQTSTVRQVFLICTESTDLESSNHQSTWPSHHPEQVISFGFSFKIMQNDTAKIFKGIKSRSLLSFKLKRVFVLIEFQKLLRLFFLSVSMNGKDRNGLKLEKVGPTLIRFLQKSVVSYFHPDLLHRWENAI